MNNQTKPSSDDWLASMFDIQSDLAKRAVDETNRLRRRVLELEAQLSGGIAADLMAAQDRITQLEQLLADSRKGLPT